MKLSKAYSNRPSVFEPVRFNEGLNAIVAEIRLPQNLHRDTHNLGKSTFGLLLDFCLLSTRDPSMSLIKHDSFNDFEFFLELRLVTGGLLTIRRSVEESSKISFKRHLEHDQDLIDLPEDQWDHYLVPFERARSILDGYLDLTDLKPWNFRNGIGYLLRGQGDYSDVFQLQRFASAHKDWKPFIAHILGFDSESIKKYYEIEERVEELRDDVGRLELSAGTAVADSGKLDGLISIKQKEIDRIQSRLEQFDFRQADVEGIGKIVDELDEQLADLNQRKYVLTFDIKRLSTALKNSQPLFSTEDAASIFGEAGIIFDGQIKRDFDQLLEFNRAIGMERKEFLSEDRTERRRELRQVNGEIEKLNVERSKLLSYVTSPDSIQKYKSASNTLVDLRAQLLALQNQRSSVDEMKRLRETKRAAESELVELGRTIEADVAAKSASDNTGLFGSIRTYFDDIIRSVIDRDALLAVSLNNKTHPVFSAEIMDDSGKATSADLGTSYKKLLCVAFDLALVRGHLDTRYPKFVYHDGIFETLDPRKKLALLGLMREYADLGVQQIITLLDSDAPIANDDDSSIPSITEDETIVKLHDEGDQGRLFKMKSW